MLIKVVAIANLAELAKLETLPTAGGVDASVEELWIVAIARRLDLSVSGGILESKRYDLAIDTRIGVVAIALKPIFRTQTVTHQQKVDKVVHKN